MLSPVRMCLSSRPTQHSRLTTCETETNTSLPVMHQREVIGCFLQGSADGSHCPTGLRLKAVKSFRKVMKFISHLSICSRNTVKKISETWFNIFDWIRVSFYNSNWSMKARKLLTDIYLLQRYLSIIDHQTVQYVSLRM